MNEERIRTLEVKTPSAHVIHRLNILSNVLEGEALFCRLWVLHLSQCPLKLKHDAPLSALALNGCPPGRTGTSPLLIRAARGMRPLIEVRGSFFAAPARGPPVGIGEGPLAPLVREIPGPGPAFWLGSRSFVHRL